MAQLGEYGVSGSDPYRFTDITASLGTAITMPRDVANADTKQSTKQPFTATPGEN